MNMKAMLIGRTGPVAGKDFAIADGVRIGAGSEAEIRIRADGVSRVHAQLSVKDEEYWLEDLASTNGTFLGGLRISRDTIHHLDVVTLGRAVDLIFVCRPDLAALADPEPRRVEAAHLEFIDGEVAGETVNLVPGETTIGRASSCTVIVSSRAVSKIHARVERTREAIVIQDVGSANGTFVNGNRIAEPVLLAEGDIVSLGGVRSFALGVSWDSPGPGVERIEETSTLGQAFAQEWRTKLIWDAEELEELAAQSPIPIPDAFPDPTSSRSARAKPAPSKASVEGPASASSGKDQPEPKRERTTTLGRDPAAGIYVKDRQASREHARLTLAAGVVSVSDGGSVNGTYVNGQQITTRVVLKAGDLIRIGNTEWQLEIDPA
jgi:pSer/pThr/pTyr-binding forkhead associated (FHA) protein